MLHGMTVPGGKHIVGMLPVPSLYGQRAGQTPFGRFLQHRHVGPSFHPKIRAAQIKGCVMRGLLVLY